MRRVLDGIIQYIIAGVILVAFLPVLGNWYNWPKEAVLFWITLSTSALVSGLLTWFITGLVENLVGRKKKAALLIINIQEKPFSITLFLVATASLFLLFFLKQ